MPYKIHTQSPANNTTSIPKEMLFAFFSLMILNSWGNNEVPVSILATIPTY